jgi:small GTP-binding protein
MTNPIPAVKVIFIGDANVGKTCLMNVLSGKEFKEPYVQTVGPEFRQLRLTIQTGDIYLQMWDTAGAECFRGVTRQYFRGTQIALICYDITVRTSFEHIEEWLDLVNEKSEGAEIILVGTKLDLAGKEKANSVSIIELASKAQIKDYRFIQTSAATSEGIKGLNELLATATSNTLKNCIVDPRPINAVGLSAKKEEPEGCC